MTENKCPLCKGTNHICSECDIPWVECKLHNSMYREACPNRPPICDDLRPDDNQDRNYRAELIAKINAMSEDEMLQVWSDLCNYGRKHDAPPWCDICETFEPIGHEHNRPCANCDCPFAYHVALNGRCTNGAHSWSCDCMKYVSPTNRTTND